MSADEQLQESLYQRRLQALSGGFPSLQKRDQRDRLNLDEDIKKLTARLQILDQIPHLQGLPAMKLFLDQVVILREASLAALVTSAGDSETMWDLRGQVRAYDGLLGVFDRTQQQTQDLAQAIKNKKDTLVRRFREDGKPNP